MLRLRAGARVVATDGRGRWSWCRYSGDGALEPDGPPAFEPTAAPALTVAFAPAKGERPEWAVQKLTEVGVDRIVVLRAERSVVRWEGGRGEAAVERLRRVAAEAAAQSRRVWLPDVVGVVETAALGGDGMALAEPGAPAPSGRVTGIAVGPEGGWSDDERSLGLPEVGLGDGVLRAETAAVVAGVLLAAHRAGTVERDGWPR